MSLYGGRTGAALSLEAAEAKRDRAITGGLEQALATGDGRVLDPLVTGDGESVSFAERGGL